MNKIFSKGILNKKVLGYELFDTSPISIAKNWVSSLDGITQSWQLSKPIAVPALRVFEIKIGFYIPYESINLWRCLVAGSGFSAKASKRDGNVPYGIRVHIGGTDYELASAWAYDEYQEIAIGADNLGNWYIRFKGAVKSFTSNTSFQIERLCRDGIVGGNDYLIGYVKNFSVSLGGTMFSSIPLTNKDQGATQLATIGDVNAFMLNFTEAVWKDESKL